MGKGKSWLNKAKVARKVKGSGKSLYGKRRGGGSGSGGSGFKKRKGGIAWTIPSSSGSGGSGSGVGGVIKKTKGGMAWTIPKDDEEEYLEDDVEEQQYSKCSDWGTPGCHSRVYSGCKGCAWQKG